MTNVRAQREASNSNIGPARELLPVVLGKLLTAVKNGGKGHSAGSLLDLQPRHAQMQMLLHSVSVTVV